MNLEMSYIQEVSDYYLIFCIIPSSTSHHKSKKLYVQRY